MRFVCIGGGTGLFTLLPGLKGTFPSAEITAVVSMMDSGGSTGRLRDEFGYLPPGDIRKCLVALSNAPQVLRQVMEYRFAAGEGLKGHNLGNLILTALKDIMPGTPEEKEYRAIEAMAEMLNIHGNVYPVTLQDCHLKATLEDGTVIRGETNIDVPKHDANKRIATLELDPPAHIFERTRDAIVKADAIVIGPGDLYTSVLPNLVVSGVKEAIKEARARKAKVIYIVSTMTKHGETDGYTASEFVRRIEALGVQPDMVVVNNGPISEQQRAAYAAEHSHPVKDDIDRKRYHVIEDDLVNREAFARHQPYKLAAAIGKVLGI